MEICFDIAGVPARFQRSWQTGLAELHTGSDVICLASPYWLSTHFRVRRRRVWQVQVDGHDVEIAKIRPRISGGVRPNSYTVSVDGQVVAEATGM
jgi:hypothetical protein